MAAVPTWMMSASFCSPAVLVNSPAPVGAVGADHPLGSLQLGRALRGQLTLSSQWVSRGSVGQAQLCSQIRLGLPRAQEPGKAGCLR